MTNDSGKQPTAVAREILKQTKWIPFLITILIGLIIWLIPSPAGVSERRWHLLAIFVATIVGLVIKPLPMGAVARL